MAYKFEGWLAHGPEAADGKMEWGPFEPKKWTEDDVDIQVTHCGVCGTDCHTLREDWGPPPYPCVVGHEIIGKAVRVGANVKHVSIGERVGVGPQSGCCEKPDCEECSSGKFNYCQEAVQTYAAHYRNNEGTAYGGYANYNRTPGRFVIKIPEGMASEHAGPLLCAGITTWKPLDKYGCGPGKSVAVVGVGGLGHLAVLFARAMGAKNVAAISRSSSKRADAEALGATEVVATSDETHWAKKRSRHFDIVILTSSATDMPIDDYLTILKAEGTLVNLGLAPGGRYPSYNAGLQLWNGLTITASLSGAPQETAKMLQFAAEKGIKPWVQTMKMKDANRALVEMEKGSPRFRLVLEQD